MDQRWAPDSESARSRAWLAIGPPYRRSVGDWGLMRSSLGLSPLSVAPWLSGHDSAVQPWTRRNQLIESCSKP
eukprot:4086930-Pyramimonas_sp.AAC.1